MVNVFNGCNDCGECNDVCALSFRTKTCLALCANVFLSLFLSFACHGAFNPLDDQIKV